MANHLRGIRTGTPVPLTERERTITRPILSVEQWGPERVAEYLADKYPVKQQKRKVDNAMPTVIEMTKEEYLAERASGKKRAQIANEIGLKHPAYLYPQLEKWGLKDATAEEEALRLFNTKSIKADKPSTELVAELKKAVEESAPTAVTLVVPPTPITDTESKPSSEAVEPLKEREPSISNPYYVSHETKAESVQYVTVRIPVRRLSKPDERYKIDRAYVLNTGVEYLQNVTMNIWDELTDILGPGDYSQQVQQFIERKVAQL